VDERSKRIIDIAIDLAERDGFAAVRLRDVAAQAEVALGTVYRRFRSKEDILVAALERESFKLRQRLVKKAIPGTNPVSRVAAFFGMATRGLCRKPNLARAIIRAMASGDAESAEKIAGFHSIMTELITAAMRGVSLGDEADVLGQDEKQEEIAFLLQQVWFAALVGWAGGLHSEKAIEKKMEAAARLLLEKSG
jgi:TetR/AcrR family transcriptional regulator, cholesterol catabolism regulator